MQPVVTSVKGKVDGFVIEQGVAQPHAREACRVGVEQELKRSTAGEWRVRVMRLRALRGRGGKRGDGSLQSQDGWH